MVLAIAVLTSTPTAVSADLYLGALGGLSTLSADGRSVFAPDVVAISLYKPENGTVANVFSGVHLNDYLGVQGNFTWNRNDFTLVSSQATGNSGISVYEQARASSQRAFSADLLGYFRQRSSRVRPYLSVGIALVHFRSEEIQVNFTRGDRRFPPREFSSTQPALRVAVGADLHIGHGWAFRYTFIEAIQRNAISNQLMPPGQRNLATFQNLFGVVKVFRGTAMSQRF